MSVRGAENFIKDRETIAYRGYTWRRINSNIYRYEYKLDGTPCMVWFTKVDPSLLPLRSLAAKHWRELHKTRRFGDGYVKAPYWPSADDVPWEIHEIEDEAAYESALTAYRANT